MRIIVSAFPLNYPTLFNFNYRAKQFLSNSHKQCSAAVPRLINKKTKQRVGKEVRKRHMGRRRWKWKVVIVIWSCNYRTMHRKRNPHQLVPSFTSTDWEHHKELSGVLHSRRGLWRSATLTIWCILSP